MIILSMELALVQMRLLMVKQFTSHRQGRRYSRQATKLGNTLFVHGKVLTEDSGRFFIEKVMKDAGSWVGFDIDTMSNGSAIAWSLDAVETIQIAQAVVGTEARTLTLLKERKRKRTPEEWQIAKKKRAVIKGKVVVKARTMKPSCNQVYYKVNGENRLKECRLICHGCSKINKYHL